MRLSLVILFLWLITTCLPAQPETIDNQVIKVDLDTTTSRSAFTCTHIDNSDSALLENLSCWIYAKSDNQEYLSIQNGINYNDFHFGLSATNPEQFNIISMVTRPQVVDHKYQFNQPNYSIPMGINNWPGSNNKEPIASYVDVNQNSVYEPSKGDYPFIRGDQCLVSVSHDELNRSTSLPSVQTSLVQYAFNFPKSGDPILDHTIGFRWVLKNQSDRTYDTAKIGVQFHALLNKLNSNYIGTDVKNNAMFAYSSNSSQNQYTSVLLLNQTLTNTMYYKNEGQTSNKNDIPTLQEHFVNYLHSQWKDGDTLKLGSTGLDGDSSISFVFPNTTLNGFSAWSEDKVGNQGGDRNGILVCQFENWTPNTYRVIEGAILFQNDVDSLDELYQRHEMLKNVYQNSDFNHLTQINPTNRVKIYPNPALLNAPIHIESEQKIALIKIYNTKGALLSEQRINGKLAYLNQTNINCQTIFIQVQFVDGTSATQVLILQ